MTSSHGFAVCPHSGLLCYARLANHFWRRRYFPRTARDPLPNVLFIAVDDLKPVLGCYGDETAITPSIDRIAKGGTVFLNAHCQWPVCGPTRASLMTSLRPEATGVMDLKTSMRAKDPDVLTLPQHFKSNGYLTAGAGKIYDPRCVDDKTTLDAPSWSLPFATACHCRSSNMAMPNKSSWRRMCMTVS